jgi:hypothetical protein
MVVEEEETIQVTMKLDKYYATSDGGIVLIYKVLPPATAFLNEFYIVSFDDGVNEIAWGVGATLQTALEAAAREWDATSIDEERNANPFREVLSQFSQ